MSDIFQILFVDVFYSVRTFLNCPENNLKIKHYYKIFIFIWKCLATDVKEEENKTGDK
jgi:hypothetical protein